MKALGRILFLLALGLAGGWLVRSYVFEAVSVATGSMAPTLFVGGHYFVNRLAYRFHPPRRGDIIVFTSPVDHETGLIKRVIAVQGDQIEIRGKKVILNGGAIEEPYAVYKRANVTLDGDYLGPLRVPDGKVFVLGDDRDESSDSSVWKDPRTGERIPFVSVESIKGKLIQLI